MRIGPREGLTFAAVLAIPLASYALVFRPQNAAIEAARQEMEHKRERLEQLRRETSQNADLARANAEIAARVAEIEDRLPNGKGVDRIVKQVSDLAVIAGLEPPTLKSGKPLEAAQYGEQPLEMTTRGDFPGLYRFLQSLEQMPRVTRITNMRIQRDEKSGGVSIAFTLSIYFRGTPEAPAEGGRA